MDERFRKMGEKCIWKDRKGNIAIAVYKDGLFYDYLLFTSLTPPMSKEDVIAWRKLRPYPERLKYLTDAEILDRTASQYSVPLFFSIPYTIAEGLIAAVQITTESLFQFSKTLSNFFNNKENIEKLKTELNQRYGVPKEEIPI